MRREESTNGDWARISDVIAMEDEER